MDREPLQSPEFVLFVFVEFSLSFDSFSLSFSFSFSLTNGTQAIKLLLSCGGCCAATGAFAGAFGGDGAL